MSIWVVHPVFRHSFNYFATTQRALPKRWFFFHENFFENYFQYNSLFNNTARHYKYDVKMLEKSLILLDEFECDFSGKIWYKECGEFCTVQS